MTAHSTSIAKDPTAIGLLAAIAQFWREFLRVAFNPYHPEQHYMRGPGPAWRAKHGTNVDP